MSDHLSALQLRLSNERARLAAASRPGEIAMRKVPKRFHDELAAWAGNK